MALYETSSPLLSLPSAADGVSVTPSGVTETFSAWVQMTASAATDMRIATIIAFPGVRAFGNFYEVEIGVGAAASEVAVAAGRGCSGSNVGANADFSDVLHIAIPADVINSGDRVSCRLRQTSTTTTAWKVSIQYWATPITGTMPAATVGPVNVPAGSRLTVSSGAANAPGAWVQVSASTDAAWTIANVLCLGPNNVNWSMDIGTGAAGFETVKWTVDSHSQWFPFSNGWQGGPWNIVLQPPFGPVAMGQRLAVRLRSPQGIGAYSVGLTVIKEDVSGAATQLPTTWTGFIQVPAASGGILNWSPWVEFIPSAATDIGILGFASSTQDNTGNTIIQWGVGAAGSEELFAECFTSYGIYGGGRFNQGIVPNRLILTGERVSCRIAVAQLSPGTFHYFNLGYHVVSSTPDYDNITDELVQQVYLDPNLQPFPLFTNASAWTAGAWVEVDASTPVSRLITAYEWQNPESVEVEVDLGIGALGAEVVVTTVRWAAGASASSGSLAYDTLPMPAIIPVASRFAIRARCSLAGVQTIKFAPHYTAEPTTPPAPPDPELPTTTYAIRWLRRSPHISDTGQRLFMDFLELKMTVGSATETGQGSDPKVMFRKSSDGGFTWSNYRYMNTGMLGNYQARAFLYQLGMARDSVLEVSGSDPTPELGLIEAYISVREGLN